MTNEQFIADRTTYTANSKSIVLTKEQNKDIPHVDGVEVTTWRDHIAYSGDYGTYIFRMLGNTNPLRCVSHSTNNEYLATKCILGNIQNTARFNRACDVIRHIASMQG